MTLDPIQAEKHRANRLHQILICDDDPIFHICAKRMINNKYVTHSAYNGEEALKIITHNSIDITLLDVHIGENQTGLDLIPRILEKDPEQSIVMASVISDFRTVREAMRLGAADYFVKNNDAEELHYVLNRVLDKKLLLKREEQYSFETLHIHRENILIGTSPKICELRKIIEKVKRCNANVLITGETGTGKELVARQLRETKANEKLIPFVAVDSSTIQNSTAESTLFGHEKGAFTGADKLTKGIFEEANNGIVYFDEISNMPLEIQSKLLRVLQEKEISRLGSTKTIPLSFRVVCATNTNLETLVKEGKFKYDLLQRLNVIPISLPPLRERSEDIPKLLEYFIAKLGPKGRKITFTENALQSLSSYSWPGNIRELSNLIIYLAAMSDQTEIDISDLPEKIAAGFSKSQVPIRRKNFYKQIQEIEAKILKQEYEQSKGNITQLASKLEMDRTHLYTKLKEFGIHKSRRITT